MATLNLIQIKKSQTTGAPGSLANAELAYTANGDVLFIGRPDGSNTVTAIGGRRYPGTLTANQALVANSTSGIDKIITANAVITTLWANGGAGTTGQALFVNSTAGVYWADVSGTPGGSNTHVQFNDSTAFGGSAGFTFDKVANNLTVANSVFGVNVVNSASLQVGTVFVANTTRVKVSNTQSFEANGGVGTAGQVLTSNASTIYWSDTVSSVSAGDGLAGGPVTTTGSLSVSAGDGIVANSTGTHVDAQNGLVANSTGLWVSGGSTLTVNSTGAHVNSDLQITSLTLSGNLTVSGALVTVDATNMVVNDSIIALARNNAADALDIGFYGQYNDGSERFVGLVWDTDQNVFELFANTTVEPTTTVDTAGVGYARATLRSFLNTGAFIANSTVVNITANSTVSSALVANTLSLTTPLPTSSGGTGVSSFTDKGVFYGSGTSTIGFLTGNAYEVLQLDASGNPTFGAIDGGTF